MYHTTVKDMMAVNFACVHGDLAVSIEKLNIKFSKCYSYIFQLSIDEQRTDEYRSISVDARSVNRLNILVTLSGYS